MEFLNGFARDFLSLFKCEWSICRIGREQSFFVVPRVLWKTVDFPKVRTSLQNQHRLKWIQIWVQPRAYTFHVRFAGRTRTHITLEINSLSSNCNKLTEAFVTPKENMCQQAHGLVDHWCCHAQDSVVKVQIEVVVVYPRAHKPWTCTKSGWLHHLLTYTRMLVGLHQSKLVETEKVVLTTRAKQTAS